LFDSFLTFPHKKNYNLKQNSNQDDDQKGYQTTKTPFTTVEHEISTLKYIHDLAKLDLGKYKDTLQEDEELLINQELLTEN